MPAKEFIMQVPGLQFGSGVALATPQPSSGNPAPNPTPTGMGVLQNVKLTLGADIKSLYGISQWAVDTAIGKRTIKGSFEFAQISNLLISQLFTGDSVTTGTTLTTEFPGEQQQVPATSLFLVTVSNHTNFSIDYGVAYLNTGVALTRVAVGVAWVATTAYALGAIVIDAVGHIQKVTTAGTSAGTIPAFSDAGSTVTDGTVIWTDEGLPAQGTYAMGAGGKYSFATLDASAEMLINYAWTSATQGSTLTAQSHPMGYGPIAGLNLVFPYEGGGIGFYLPNVRLGKIDVATKVEDYAMYSVDYEGFAGANGVPFYSYQAF
jgi:hypothetical protein